MHFRAFLCNSVTLWLGVRPNSASASAGVPAEVTSRDGAQALARDSVEVRLCTGVVGHGCARCVGIAGIPVHCIRWQRFVMRLGKGLLSGIKGGCEEERRGVDVDIPEYWIVGPDSFSCGDMLRWDLMQVDNGTQARKSHHFQCYLNQSTSLWHYRSCRAQWRRFS